MEPNCTLTQRQLTTLLEIAVLGSFHHSPWRAEQIIPVVRQLWPLLEAYDQRQILCHMEVEVALSKDRDHAARELWSALVEELMPPKAPFTVVYTCGKCKVNGVKLWRGVHGCSDDDGNTLLCARCLSPKARVDNDGRVDSDSFQRKTDQVEGWLPAVPVDDTFWGYTSVPTADLRWWRGLPTYLPTSNEGVCVP
jgi:hypothetical protein